MTDIEQIAQEIIKEQIELLDGAASFLTDINKNIKSLTHAYVTCSNKATADARLLDLARSLITEAKKVERDANVIRTSVAALSVALKHMDEFQKAFDNLEQAGQEQQ